MVGESSLVRNGLPRVQGREAQTLDWKQDQVTSKILRSPESEGFKESKSQDGAGRGICKFTVVRLRMPMCEHNMHDCKSSRPLVNPTSANPVTQSLLILMNRSGCIQWVVGNPEHFAPELYGKMFGITYDPL